MRFERDRTTMLTSDWSQLGMGCAIFQKNCSCKPKEGDTNWDAAKQDGKSC